MKSLTLVALAMLALAIPTATAGFDVHAFGGSQHEGSCSEGEFGYAANHLRGWARVQNYEAGADVRTECYRSTAWGEQQDTRLDAAVYVLDWEGEYYEAGLHWYESRIHDAIFCGMHLYLLTEIVDVGCLAGGPPRAPGVLP